MYHGAVIDSHCHLAAPEFAHDLDAVLARAAAAGVTRMICIADTLEEGKRGLALAEIYDQIFCTVGVHPHHANDFLPATRATLNALADSSKKVKAIGEIGLDYHYDFSPREVQRSVFTEQLALAKALKLPAVIHCRSALNHSLRSGSGQAVEDVWAIVDEIKPPRLVMHCCTEKWEDVARFVDRGYSLSFTGIATYPKSDEVRRTIRECPLGQLMIETDAPFLPPEALRAKGGRSTRNEPAFVVEVARCVAEAKALSLQEVDDVTTANAERFFGLHHS